VNSPAAPQGTPGDQGREAVSLIIEDLVAGYGEVVALDKVTITAEAATITAVLGANGAGKTTLLRAISGMVRPRSGRVLLDGADRTGRSPEDMARAGIAHVPEGQGVIAELTVEENLRIGMMSWPGIAPRRADRAAALAEAYERFGVLADRRRKLAATLSGGERQMLVIARALVARPRVLLLDEPSLGLAPRIMTQVMDMVVRLSRENGITIVLVEQNARGALAIADLGVVLNLGRVVATADARTLATDVALRHHYLGFLVNPTERRKRMVEFLQFTLSGLSFGMIYAAIALSLVLIWRGTRLLNFAQGGMAMFTTYIALEVIRHTGSYWAGFAVALAAGVVLGAAAELAVIRPALGKPELNAVIITIGLLILLEGLAGIFYGGQYRSFPAAFSIIGLKAGSTPLGVSRFDVFVALAVLAATLLLAIGFRYTSAGLRMRAAAFNATVARLSGIRVARVITVGWALAGLLGALAGVLVTPSTFLYPNSMDSIFVFGFTAAVIGGLDSPLGAVVGGLLLGVALSYAGGYLGSQGSDLTALVALGILVVVLMLRPDGIFSGARVRRV
jgi:ABC-type branched-subunit amino acid transport system ATPase component/branched-subunit amino acid ABC-type transport system permease component